MPKPLPSTVGTFLSRIVVPLWVLTGATFKAFHATPKNLPPTIFRTADGMGVDLMLLLWVIVGIEFLAVGVMLFIPRLARIMAIFILSVFCLVLLAEMATGNFFESCGCLGDIKLPPWAMLLGDGGLLAGILLSRRTEPAPPPTAGIRSLAAGVWTVAGVAASAAMINPWASVEPVLTTNGNGDTPAGARTPKPLDPYYVADCDTWTGKRWDEIDLAQYMIEWPKDVEQGRQYVIFYGRSCEHCEEMFSLHFADPPPVPTTIVAVPESKTGFDEEAALPHFCNGCAELELPVGSDWVMTTPIVVALEDGVVKCAIEGEDPELPSCLIWH